MRAVDDLLLTMNIEESQFKRMIPRVPWGIAFPSRHVARLLLVARGSCWLTGAGLAEPLLLRTNDCFLVRAGVTFELQDRPGRALIDCEDFESAAEGVDDDETAEILSSRFTFDAVAADALFSLLPPLFRIDVDERSGRRLRATFDLIAQETAEGAVGSGFISARLSDILFVQALRAFSTGSAGSVGWLAALRDPLLAPAINAMHADLAHPWTIGELAHVAGMSRSAFAALFRDRTGDTPLGYLTTWRLFRAKALLRDTEMSLQEIAAQVGYRTGQALSRTFARREGQSAGSWRRSTRTNDRKSGAEAI
ncbi:AraC family transcriptional regulator [Actinoallomurus rhizosphaericola]|uniref:AraC family transcriptional regulator n=1 Tax=Actinoallomurus rhizosphaericola TaxID=2952536 RepID=UPI0020913565|nr:AraC family transcriptional regulator [Actinoallomurus rhizosphaericola]MCO5992376.1 AraC family transcriptional regulator [Actinoallomurus rhizosphaericola]